MSSASCATDPVASLVLARARARARLAENARLRRGGGRRSSTRASARSRCRVLHSRSSLRDPSASASSASASAARSASPAARSASARSLEHGRRPRSSPADVECPRVAGAGARAAPGRRRPELERALVVARGGRKGVEGERAARRPRGGRGGLAPREVRSRPAPRLASTRARPCSGARASRRDPRADRAFRATRPRAVLLARAALAGSARRRPRGRARAGMRTRPRRRPMLRRSAARTPSLERVQRCLESPPLVVPSAPAQNTRPSTAASWSSSFSSRSERVEAGRDDALHRLRERQSSAGRARRSRRTNSSAYSGLPPARSSSVAWTSAGIAARLEQRVHELRRLVVGERRERERRAHSSLPPPQPGRRASSSGRAVRDDEQRHAASPSRRGGRRSRAARRPPSGGPRRRGRAGAGRRAPRGSAARPRTPRSWRSPPARPSPRGPPSGRRCALDPAATSLGRRASPRRPARSFSAASARRSVSRMPAWALTISPSAQKLTPSP